MKNILFLLLFCISNILFAQAADKNKVAKAGIIYGNDYSFMVSTPKGWVLDDTSGASSKLNAVFYPIGGGWKKSPAVLYVNAISKSTKDFETLQKVIFADTSKFTANNNARVESVGKLKTKDKKEAEVIYFTYSRFEAVAYIDEPKCVAMIVLSAKNLPDFKKSVKTFKEMVASYYFLTEKVVFDKKK